MRKTEVFFGFLCTNGTQNAMLYIEARTASQQGGLTMKEHYKGLGHIAIYTADMEQSIAFYENIGGSVFKRDGVQTPDGEKKLALVEFGGFLLELIEPPAGTLVPSPEGI